jgi:hypothetical protein
MAVMLKRYAVFAGETYYPRGGMEDFKESFDDFLEAIAHMHDIAGRYAKQDGKYDKYDWGHVADMTTGEIIEETI